MSYWACRYNRSPTFSFVMTNRLLLLQISGLKVHSGWTWAFFCYLLARDWIIYARCSTSKFSWKRGLFRRIALVLLLILGRNVFWLLKAWLIWLVSWLVFYSIFVPSFSSRFITFGSFSLRISAMNLLWINKLCTYELIYGAKDGRCCLTTSFRCCSRSVRTCLYRSFIGAWLTLLSG